MATLQINIPDQRAAALKAYAQARGLTVEKWLEQLVEQAEPSFLVEINSIDTRPIWEVIQDNRKTFYRKTLPFCLETGQARSIITSTASPREKGEGHFCRHILLRRFDQHRGQFSRPRP